MNKFEIQILKSFKKLGTVFLNEPKINLPMCEQDPEVAGSIIRNILASDQPCMIARFGSTELTCLKNYLGVKNHSNQYLSYLKGESPPWWWEPSIIQQMKEWSGFFPPQIDSIERFCEMMLEDMKEVDVLGSWLPEEKLFKQELIGVNKVRLYTLEPFWSKHPWTIALKNKKVLVVHPFSETIEKQYKQRQHIFKNDLLPFFELKTLTAVQSLGGKSEKFQNWFEALDYMKNQIDEIDYDICLIGAGAYGFPLGAHIKRKGKKAFHLGGSLQLLFGIKGKRWENPNYGIKAGISYPSLFNDFWVRPSELEKPQNAKQVEDNCYW